MFNSLTTVTSYDGKFYSPFNDHYVVRCNLPYIYYNWLYTLYFVLRRQIWVPRRLLQLYMMMKGQQLLKDSCCNTVCVNSCHKIIDHYSSQSALHKLQFTPSLSNLYMVGQSILCSRDRYAILTVQSFIDSKAIAFLSFVYRLLPYPFVLTWLDSLRRD